MVAVWGVGRLVGWFGLGRKEKELGRGFFNFFLKKTSFVLALGFLTHIHILVMKYREGIFFCKICGMVIWGVGGGIV